MGFALIIFMLEYQTKAKYMTSTDCGNLQYTKITAYNDYLKPELEQEGFMDCYCMQEFRSTFYQVATLTFANGETPCKDWLEQFHLALTAVYGLTMSIAILNAMLRVFLREISAFEGKHTVTIRLAASTRKMWIIQFVNTALILFLINYNLPDTSRIRELFKLPE